MEFAFGIHIPEYPFLMTWGKTGHMANLGKRGHPDNIPDGKREDRDIREIRRRPFFIFMISGQNVPKCGRVAQHQAARNCHYFHYFHDFH